MSDNAPAGHILVERDLETGQERLLAPEQDPHRGFDHRVVSPAGRWEFLRNRGSREIFRLDRETEEIDLFYRAEDSVEAFRLAPDSRDLLVATHSAQTRLFTISRIEIESRKRTYVTTSRLKPAPSWSPDGQEIAYSEINCLMLVSREEGNPRALACSDPPLDWDVGLPAWAGALLPRMLWLDETSVSWSPDGRRILWAVPVLSLDRVELRVVDRETGNHQTLWAGEEGYGTIPRGPVWSPRGDRIAFSIRKFPPTEVWAMRGALRQAELH